MLHQQTCQRLTLADIHSATHNFDETLVIGRGGFGKVYKCHSKILSVNAVAVKRLHYMSNQGANEFEAEVKVLSNLRHANLVSLIGYCHEGNEIVLVYEFMPNGTLEDHLHKGDTDLSWLERLNICIGVARGLDYLHTGTSTQRGVIHRDVKSSNILLDAKFAAKISDFGLAKISPINQTISFVNTRVKGTFGYIDPCYFFSGNLTRKSDVYAFGVVLLEVLSGKQAVDQTIDEEQWSLAVWAQDQIKEGKLNQIIDSRLIGQISKKCLKEFTSIAYCCLHNQPKRRPTMAEVVVKLDSILLQERERADSGVHEVRLINRVRYFFSGQSDLMPAPAHNIQRSENQSLRKYTYAELVSATNNFDIKEFSTNLLENVYKGWVDGRTYAPTESGVGISMYVKKRPMYVKKWHTVTSKLDLKPEEFNHSNLVKLFGYCLNDGELSCVYELRPDTSLDKLLFTEPGKTSLSWVARLKIALGAARGLSFLHQRKHPAYSQFKTSCILVDMEYNARLRDFEVEVPYFAIGSYSFKMDAPYAAPEWFRYLADVGFDGLLGGHCYGSGVKSEIYSFGLVLVEILTGMKVYEVGKQNLVRWATDILLEDNIDSCLISDPQHQYDIHASKGALLKLAQLVSNCLRPLQDERPSMKEIVQVLCQCYEKETKIPVIKEPEVRIQTVKKGSI